MIASALAGGVELVQTAINDRGSFGEYVRAILDSRELVQFWVLLGAGFVGATANYLFKWARDEIEGSLWDYVTKQYPKRTFLALMTFVGCCATLVLSSTLDGSGWGIIVFTGFNTGFTIDATVNKSKTKVWTDAERTTKLEKPT